MTRLDGMSSYSQNLNNTQTTQLRNTQAQDRTVDGTNTNKAQVIQDLQNAINTNSTVEIVTSLSGNRAQSVTLTRAQAQELLNSYTQGSLPLSQVNIQTAAPGPTGLSGQPIGNFNGNRLHLGSQVGGAHNTEQAARTAARAEWGVTDDPDMAVIRGNDGKFYVYTVEARQNGSGDHDDMNDYADLRSANATPTLPGGATMVSLVDDDNGVRYFTGQPTPTGRNYGAEFPVTDPTGSDTYETLHAKMETCVNRLHAMAQDYGRAGDHRGVFANMYEVITRRALVELEKFHNSGQNQEALFEGRLVVNFANKLFKASDAYAAGDMNNVSEVWRTAFDAGRNAQEMGTLYRSVSEVTGLSMAAHIIHDLPLTLQEIRSLNPPTDVAQPNLEVAFDSFNGALMEEKDRIMGAISRHYGSSDMSLLQGMFEGGMTGVGAGLGTVLGGLPGGAGGAYGGHRAANGVELGVFTAMRSYGKYEANQRMSQAQIQNNAVRMQNWVNSLPGGN
ncbi:MAG: DUF5995 family protein [Candidatus Sericytochromatia bacterium]